MSDNLPALFDMGAFERPRPPRNISKTERAELRSIVKGKFKVLRAEVDERRAEMYADIEIQVAKHFAGEDVAWEGFLHVCYEAQMEANRAINDARRAGGFDEGEGEYEHNYVTVRVGAKPVHKRAEMKAIAQTQVDTQVRTAILRLDRQEQELLEQLSVGALESEAAQTFLSSIPKVGDLVSADSMSDLARMVDDLELGMGDE
jgi:hypothetical protein